MEELLEEPDLPKEEKATLLKFLTNHHHAFCLEEGERGETDLVLMEIETGDACPKRQRVRRMPPLVRHEVARQLEEMQRNGVIQPSKSPWASPVVLVKKRDGSHRFCVDYRGLNAVTTPDSFPLPHIDESTIYSTSSLNRSTSQQMLWLVDSGKFACTHQLRRRRRLWSHRVCSSSGSCPSD